MDENRHIITVDNIINDDVYHLEKKKRRKIKLFEDGTQIRYRILNNLWYCKSVLIQVKYPGVYYIEFETINPIRCSMRKLIKNKNLYNSLIYNENNNLYYKYNKHIMEFQEAPATLESSKSTRDLHKNNFKKITNILSSHKNELKLLVVENDNLKIDLKKLTFEYEEQTNKVLTIQLDNSDLSDELDICKQKIKELNQDNQELENKNKKLEFLLNEFCEDLDLLSNQLENELIISVCCNIPKKTLKCDRVSLPFKIVDDKFIFTEKCKAKIIVPKNIIICLKRDSELIQSQALLEKQFLENDIITVSGNEKNDFYMDISFQ